MHNAEDAVARTCTLNGENRILVGKPEIIKKKH
jgi:hypothetical protein